MGRIMVTGSGDGCVDGAQLCRHICHARFLEKIRHIIAWIWGAEFGNRVVLECHSSVRRVIVGTTQAIEIARDNSCFLSFVYDREKPLRFLESRFFRARVEVDIPDSEWRVMMHNGDFDGAMPKAVAHAARIYERDFRKSYKLELRIAITELPVVILSCGGERFEACR